MLLLACVPVAMWVGQTALLWRCGLPARWRLDAGDAPRSVRTGARIITQTLLASVIVVFPLVLGQSPTTYYARLLPACDAARQFAFGAAAAVLCLCVLYGAWLATGRVYVEVHQSRRRWSRRLLLLPLTALLGAGVEELLFRGVLLADLLRSFGPTAAIAIGAAVFAVAHYVRGAKRRWTIGGHVMLGVLLCVAFVRTQALWLPIGLHAGGILMIMGARPFIRYDGPGWLTGASIFPFAGATGIAGLAILTAFVAAQFGGGG